MSPHSILPATAGLLNIIVCISLIGCASYATLERGYREEANQTNSIVIVMDAIIFRDVSGRQHAIHLPKSRQMLRWSHDAVVQIVEQKGYRVSDQSLLSIGLSEKPGESYRVFNNDDQENPDWASARELELQSVPIDLSVSGFDEASVDAFSNLLWKLMELRTLGPTQGQYYPAVKNLILAADSLLLVMQSVGVQFPTWKKVVEAIVSAPFAIGGNAGWESDHTFHMLVIINPAGTVLWADRFWSPIGGHKDESDLRKDLERLFSHLPNHPKNLTVSE